MVEGGVSLHWGLFLGEGLYYKHPKNPTRAYFQVRSYFRGNRVSPSVYALQSKIRRDSDYSRRDTHTNKWKKKEKGERHVNDYSFMYLRN